MPLSDSLSVIRLSETLFVVSESMCPLDSLCYTSVENLVCGVRKHASLRTPLCRPLSDNLQTRAKHSAGPAVKICPLTSLKKPFADSCPEACL